MDFSPPEPVGFAGALLDALGKRLSQLAAQGFAPIRDAWLARGPAPGTPVTIRGNAAPRAGRFAGAFPASLVHEIASSTIASRNPLASVGASREMKLVIGYELPFLLAMAVPVIKSGGELQLVKLLEYQAQSGAFAASASGIIALIVMILCLQAKMALVPFDQAEAETEVMGGALIEYSGPALGIYKLTKMLMFYAAPMFVVVLLWGGFGTLDTRGIVLGIVKYLVLVVLITLIRNTNPRVRIEHAVKFFWGTATLLALAAVLIAIVESLPSAAQ